MSVGPNPFAEPQSIVAAYCAEFQKLAATLVDMLDVSRRGGQEIASQDATALRALTPMLQRLGLHMEAIDADAGRRDPTFGVGRFTESGCDVAALSRPAVRASIERMLGEPPQDADDLQYEVRPGPGSFPSATVGDECGAEPPDGECEVAPESETASESPRELVPEDRLFDTLLEAIDGSATLQGTSQSLPIPGLFELISGSGKTGLLHLRTPAEHMRFGFADGLVVMTDTDAPPPGQRLGDLLAGLGFVTRADLDAAVGSAVEGGRPLGSRLISSGAISIEQLTQALELQVQSRFDRVFREDAVAYAFVPDDRDGGDGRLRMNTRGLFLQSACRADEDSWASTETDPVSE